MTFYIIHYMYKVVIGLLVQVGYKSSKNYESSYNYCIVYTMAAIKRKLTVT